MLWILTYVYKQQPAAALNYLKFKTQNHLFAQNFIAA